MTASPSDPVGSKAARPISARAVIVAAAAAVLLWLVLLVSPLGTTALEVTTTSTSDGNSLMTFSAPTSAQPRAVTEPLRAGSNVVRFAYGATQLPLGQEQNWTPCDCATTLEVTHLTLRSAVLSAELPLTRLSAEHGVLEFVPGATVVSITIDPGVVHSPRVQVISNTSGFVAATAAILFAIALGVVGLGLVAFVGLRGILRREDGAVARAWNRARATLASTVAGERAAQSVARAAHFVAAPRALVIIAAVVAVINVVMMFWGGVVLGNWVDEPTHVARLQGYLDEGWFLPPSFLQDGNPAPDVPDTYVYGPVQALVGHILSLAIGADTLSTASTTAAAYAARHVGVGLLALAALAGAFGLARRLVGSWRWGVVAVAVLTAIPLYTGHGMFNPKDVAVAAGFTLATLGFARIADISAVTSWKAAVAASATLTIGTVLAIGTRPGIWPAFLAGYIVLVVGTGIYLRSPRRAVSIVVRAVIAGWALAVGWFITFLIYPRAFGNPLALLTQSFSTSAEYPSFHVPAELTYIPEWLAIQIPLLILGLTVVGIVLALVALVRGLGPARPEWSPSRLTLVALVMAQLLLIPVFTVIRHSVLYNGLRQLEFILPAMAVLATLAIAALFAWTHRRRVASIGIVVVASIALIVPTVEQGMLFPYNSQYTSVATGLVYVHDSADEPGDDAIVPAPHTATGNSNISARELAPNLAPTSLLRCSNLVGPTYPLYTIDVGTTPCLQLRNISPYLPVPDGALQPAPNEYYVFDSAVDRLDEATLNTCEEVAAVSRAQLFRTVVISRLLECERPAPHVEPGQTLSFADEQNRDLLHDNWSYPRPAGVWSLGRQAGLRMSVPDGPEDLALTLVGYRFIPAGETRSMSVLVNGTLLGEANFSSRWTSTDVSVVIPRSLVGPDGEISVSIYTPDPVVPSQIAEGPNNEPLGFWLESLRIEALPRD